MPLPRKKFCTVNEARDFLTSIFDEPCNIYTFWDYIVNGELQLCLCLNEFMLPNRYDDISDKNQNSDPSEDAEKLINKDCLVYVCPADMPREYSDWFHYNHVLTVKNNTNTQCSIVKFNETTRYCMIDFDTATGEYEFGGAPTSVLNNYDLAYILFEEIEEFAQTHGANTQPIIELTGVQKQRELVLAGWLRGKGSAIDHNSLSMTRAKLWDELSEANSDLFRISTEETVKKDFAEQKLVNFRSGRPRRE